MSQNKKTQEAPLVWTVGCGAARSSLAAAGLALRSKRSVSQSLKRDGSRPRAIIIHRAALPRSEVTASLRQLRRNWPLVDILLWAPDASGEYVRSSLQAGAIDVVLSRSPERLAEVAKSTVAEQKFLPRSTGSRGGETKTRFEGLVSRSQRMWDLFDLCVRIAPTEATVLIEGETGTGKELVARAIHRRSGRKERFVPLNCGAIPTELVDSELFGHEKGSFTGATVRKDGMFRHAEGGTIFLDEIGSIAEPTQVRLLRTLQEGTVRPVGANEEVPIDVRVIAASSEPLEALVEEERFRSDLLYRLDVIRLQLPALRQRPEDIIFLFAQFSATTAKRYQVERPEVDESFLDALTRYEWPGNVRQLENFTERLILTHPSSAQLDASHFSRLVQHDAQVTGKTNEPTAVMNHPDLNDLSASGSLDEVMDRVVEATEERYLRECLRRNRGRMEQTAEAAGISRRTLLRKLQKHGIDKMEFRR